MKTTFMFPLLGLFVEKQMRRFRITVRLYKSELSAGSRSYGAIKRGDLRLSYYARLVALPLRSRRRRRVPPPGT